MNTHLITQRITVTTLAAILMTNPIAAISASSPIPIPTVVVATTSEPELPIDLVDERPTFVEKVWSYSTFPITWTWDIFQNNVLSWFAIPSPASIMRSVSKKDASMLFKLLSEAGYKLKEIAVDVGIIPTLSFKFVQARELSEADYEYLETQLIDWERANPGIYSGIQRRIIKMVMAINLNSEYKVSALKVKLLPLPDVAFEMMPGGVSDFVAIMNAINKVGRSIREVSNVKVHSESDKISSSKP